MKKRYLVLVLVLSLFLTGCLGSGNLIVEKDNIDKSTRIVRYITPGEEINSTEYELEYIKDGKKYTVWFVPALQPSLDWLRENSKPSDKVMTWWDNGHLIRGYARREPIVYTPHYDLLETVAGGEWDENELGEFSNKDDLTNIAYAFLADSPTIMQGITRKYNARWVYVARMDMKKIAGMVQLMDEDMDNYLDELGQPKASVREKVIFKMADGWNVKGFNLRYEDDYVYIYEVQ